MKEGTIGQRLDPAHNSLNFLRLVLAFCVVYTHATELGWLGWRNVIVNGTSLGTIAVYGFFGISGYLIAGSATKNGVGRYLWQRFLRIMPAFWVCLVITAFVFGAVAFMRQPEGKCNLGCFFTLHPGPITFVSSNALLKINQAQVSPRVWVDNGSLWTLLYEFLCYVFLAVLSMMGVLRRRGLVVVISVALLGLLSTMTLIPRFNQVFNGGHNVIPMEFLILSVIFMAGSLIYLYRYLIPDSWLLAVGCVGAFLASLYLPTYGYIPTYRLTASCLGAFLIAYPILWLGIHLPLQRVGSKNDYSYGVYIYAFPLTQLLVLYDAERLGFVPFMVLVAVVTVAFAVASWWLVEKRALRWKKVGWPPRLTVRAAPVTEPDRTIDLEATKQAVGGRSKPPVGTVLDQD